MIRIEEISDSAKYISSIIKDTPDIAIILGSGLGPLADVVNNSTTIEYIDIPGFSKATVLGHEGKLIYGTIGDKKVLVMKGRFHYYEGYEIDRVVFPIRVFKLLGINNILVTNAAGGINLDFSPGDLMLITDHLGANCPSPLRGQNIDELGERFPDMSSCYDRKLLKYAKRCAKKLDIKTRSGIYAFAKGPMFETPAEIRALRAVGADAVGMSTVPEVTAANHMSMKILGISCITNMAAGILDKPLTHKEVMIAARSIEKRFSEYVIELIKGWVI